MAWLVLKLKGNEIKWKNPVSQAYIVDRDGKLLHKVQVSVIRSRVSDILSHFPLVSMNLEPSCCMEIVDLYSFTGSKISSCMPLWSFLSFKGPFTLLTFCDFIKVAHTYERAL